MKRVFIIDHHDSFTQNIVAEFESLGAQTVVLSLERARPLQTDTLCTALSSCDGLVLSPGPGHPQDYLYGELPHLLASRWSCLPVFGVCLGMQLLLHWDGFPIEALFKIEQRSSDGLVVHGRTEALSTGNSPLPHPFSAIDPQTPVVFYNSLGLLATNCNKFDQRNKASGPAWNFVTNLSQPASVNIACHRVLPHFGVQFHPESFASPKGSEFFKAFLKIVEGHPCHV